MPPTADDPLATAGRSPHPAGPDRNAGDLVQITPRALAGPGEPATALEVLREAGWQVGDDDLANAHAWSPHAPVYVGFLPEGDAGRQHARTDAGTARTCGRSAPTAIPTPQARCGPPRSRTPRPPIWSPRSWPP